MRFIKAFQFDDCRLREISNKKSEEEKHRINYKREKKIGENAESRV